MWSLNEEFFQERATNAFENINGYTVKKKKKKPPVAFAETYSFYFYLELEPREHF